jgi:DNA ligase-1
VREVEKSMVLEVAFDAAQLSTRHKSGVAMRFPRIARIRTDKPASEADRLESLMALVENRASPPDPDQVAPPLESPLRRGCTGSTRAESRPPAPMLPK